MRSTFRALSVLAVASAVASPARAADGAAPIEWRWAPVRTGDYVAAASGLAVAIGAAAAPVPSWHFAGKNDFDTAVRDTLRPDSFAARQTASDMSDVLLAGSLTFPILFDGLVTAWGTRSSGEAARQMIVIDAETIAVTAGLTAITSTLVARERPYAAFGTCETELGEAHRDCLEKYHYRYRSFFSGHTSLAFAGASLVCVHHARLGLYGGALDAVACGVGLAAAAATGTFRIVADQHYATDVLTGIAVGTAVGFGLPWAFHYSRPLETTSQLQVFVVPSPTGLTVAGIF